MKTKPYYTVNITVESTNGSTLRQGIEKVLEQLHQFQIPKDGVLIDVDSFKVKIETTTAW